MSLIKRPKFPKAAQEVIHTLRMQGIRFNIVNMVGYRIELHYVYTTLKGHEQVSFVAELDTFGNITEWGPCMANDATTAIKIPERNYVLNADGEIV